MRKLQPPLLTPFASTRERGEGAARFTAGVAARCRLLFRMAYAAVTDASRRQTPVMRSFVLLVVLALAAAQVAYPNNPECGWGDQVYRAVGDWPQDAGSANNWAADESKGVMTATHAQACEYKATVTGLRPGKLYNWKVTIGGSYNVNWGCVGMNGPNCNFTADQNGGVVFRIVASYSYTLSTSATNGSSPQPQPQPTSSNGYQYVGCYKDDGNRDLTGKYTENVGSVAQCASICQGFSYFAVQYSTQCFCGNSYGRYGQAPESDCNMKCNDGSSRCGSGWRNSVYSTGKTPSPNPTTQSPTPTTKNPTPTPTTQNPTPQPSNGRAVFAHYMMGYANNNDQSYFEKEMKLAKAVGIDAFAVNCGTDSWQKDKIGQMLAAANNVGFKIFVSFDMTVWGSNGWDGMTDWMNSFADNSAYFKYNGRPFVSTFYANFGGMDNNAWGNWKNRVNKNLYLCPNFFPNSYQQYSNVDCLFGWDAWGKQSSSDRDNGLMSQSGGKQYMVGVAPWFFCHLPQWGKNWVWPQGTSDGDENIYAIRWQQAIKSSAQFVEVITWNDYSESSYITPLLDAGHTFDASDFYTNGQFHAGFWGMTAYYANWFKTGGSQPSKNSVYWSYRRHATNQDRNDDRGALTMNWTPNDCVSMHAISANPGAQVNVNIGGRDNWHTISGTTDTWCVSYGGTGAVRVSVKNNGQTTNANTNGPDIEGYGQYRNFNPFSGVMDY
ncbi:hypothetical protein PROFUN_09268 [Planoprotostelium fungivorum]|uniref:WSC domain-containing protein n=1 Tax=Planoprotostelium fungivorum TaxID=1890364 RepID=A0A2P6NKU7_9EUKA|nr:hypothetical protein PROFUN_09268 [Planoprotostelium fungivorum]